MRNKSKPKPWKRYLGAGIFIAVLIVLGIAAWSEYGSKFESMTTVEKELAVIIVLLLLRLPSWRSTHEERWKDEIRTMFDELLDTVRNDIGPKVYYERDLHD
jgi:hypothetical protein